MQRMSYFHYNLYKHSKLCRSGDVIIAVNGLSLTDVTHGQAVALLKTTELSVTLRVVSWPGSRV